MITYKCPSCGAQLDLFDAGGFTCPYCNSRSFLSDSQLRGNTEFRKKILGYYSIRAQEDDYTEDTLWEETGKATYNIKNGQKLIISYMDKYKYPGMICYLAQKNVVYVFESSNMADAFMKGLMSMSFPEADVKLDRCFPKLSQKVNLVNGEIALAFIRKPFFYPAEILSPYKPEHLAWIISRMENLCCALEFSGLSFGDITPSSVFINAVTHEGMLFGDWRSVQCGGSLKDLFAIRETAKRMMTKDPAPKEFAEFLNSVPKQDAFDDFKYWDSVIETGFGGHKFVKM